MPGTTLEVSTDNMNQALMYISGGLFAILPTAVLLARYRYKAHVPWWMVAGTIVVVGWISANLATYFYFEYQCAPLRQSWVFSKEALRRCTSDGGRIVFSLLLGWLYALIYSVPFLVLYLVVPVRKPDIKRQSKGGK